MWLSNEVLKMSKFKDFELLKMSFTFNLSLSQSYVDHSMATIFFSDAHWTWSVENFLGSCEAICEVVCNDMRSIGRLNEEIH